MKRQLKTILGGVILIMALHAPAFAVDNLLTNPGFEGPGLGAGWGTWGNTDFNTFWGPDAHASLYADWVGNNGGVFQVAIGGLAGTTYQFTLYNTRIEQSFDADLYCGLEYYDADDATKLGESMVLLNTDARLANAQVDGNVFTVAGTAPAGTVFVRPVFRFDNVNPNYLAQPQASAFVFNTFLNVAPAVGQEFLRNPGFEDLNFDGTLGDYWGKWGNIDFNAFFGANGHASLFADQVGNSGGVWQQGILGTSGRKYRFDLTDVRIEANWDADLYCGIEYFGDDDFVKLAETVVLLDTSVPGDGLTYSVTGTAPPGTVYVRPYFRFDSVGTSGGSERSAFVFHAALTELPATEPGDLNCDGIVDFKDINPFVLILSNLAGWEAAYPGCPWQNGDCNSDGAVNFKDINPFVALLSGG